MARRKSNVVNRQISMSWNELRSSFFLKEKFEKVIALWNLIFFSQHPFFLHFWTFQTKVKNNFQFWPPIFFEKPTAHFFFVCTFMFWALFFNKVILESYWFFQPFACWFCCLLASLSSYSFVLRQLLLLFRYWWGAVTNDNDSWMLLHRRVRLNQGRMKFWILMTMKLTLVIKRLRSIWRVSAQL